MTCHLRGMALRVFFIAEVFLGCASTQRIVLDAGPRPLDVYVDGRLEPAPAEEIQLVCNRRHTLYLKKPGYHSELVLVESNQASDARQVEPVTVRVRLRPRAGPGRELGRNDALLEQRTVPAEESDLDP